jgi:tRNA nucleotidyltransferase/poly(A) polymerase
MAMKNQYLRRYVEYLVENILLEIENSTSPIRKKFPISLPPDLLRLSKMFKANNKGFWLVGGSVRDALMGKQPKDLDVATDAQPDDTIDILKQDPSLKILEIGKSFGVVKVITPEGGEFEIATLRTDVGKGRRPDAVNFVSSIEQDQQRRDLRINALFYDIETQEIIDYVGGIEDIEKGVIRTVGSPQERFDEDRLRILRAIRFAARIGSGLDPETAQAIKSNNSLDGVSGERIRDEFLKGIKSAKSVPQFLNLISEFDLWPQIFPGMVVSRDFKDTKNIPVALAVLLRENSPKVIMGKLNNLKYSADEVSQVSFLAAFLGLNVPNAYKMKKLFKNSRLSSQDLEEFSRLVGNPPEHLVKVFLRYEPSITGLELQNQGFQGKELGAEMERR